MDGGGKCIVSNETCASRCQCMAEACARGFYEQHQTESILHCLTTQENKVRCPELGPSDIWGLFPVGCTTQECAIASSWATGGGSIPFDGARFLTDGRAGLRVPNYKHVNATYHHAINYYNQSRQSEPIEECFNVDELVSSPSSDAPLTRLLPAVQLRFDSPVTAVCTRYLVESALAEARSSSSSGPKVAEWKRRCEAKIRQLASCDALGIYYDVEPPAPYGGGAKGAGDGAEDCGMPLPDASFYYAAGGACVLVDRKNRIMYDGPQCMKNGAVIDKNCELVPQPLSLLQGDMPYSMLWW
jgi:hypothetical protein